MDQKGIPPIGVYGSINNNAHRQAAELIGAPALVWHQALWNPARLDEKLHWTADIRAERLQSYIKGVFNKISQIPDSDCELTNDIEVRPEDRARVIALHFRWNSLLAKVRFEIHTEYLTVMSVIDASYKPEINESKNQTFNRIESSLNKFGSLFCTGSLPDLDPGNLQTYLYDEIWDRSFFPQILNVGEDLTKGRLGQKFADFRGIITSEMYPPEEERASEDITINRLERQPIQKPFYKDKPFKREDWQRTSYPDEQWARSRLNSVWPVLAENPKDKIRHLNGRTEFTANRLSDGRILYLTAFAPQPLEGSKESPQSLYFYIHSSTQCERVLGRVVDRLTQLGTLRLAAMMPLPALKEIRSILEIVETDLARARDKTHLLIQYSKGTEQRDRLYIKDKEREILQLLDRIQRLMAGLSKGNIYDVLDEKFGIADVSKEGLRTLGDYLGDATLEYRLVRSRFYKKNFVDMMGGLRIKRLEGYQPYNEFVNRRLGGAFGFIEGVEERISLIKQNWRVLDQLYLTTAVTILAGEIDSQQEIAVKQQEVANKTNTRVERIQIWGEIILVGILMPYYLMGIFGHVTDCEKAAWCHSEVAQTRFSVGQAFYIVTFLGCFAAAVSKRKHLVHLKNLNVIQGPKRFFLSVGGWFPRRDKHKG